MDALLDKRTTSKVKSTLKAMNKTSQAPDQSYDQAYSEAIQRIKCQLPEDTALAMCVLAWIINAKRPLTIVELCHAVAIEPKQEILDPEDIPDINDLVSVCAGLISVDEESEIVRLVHYTTQKYLERTQDLWNPGSRLSVASACLTYLSFPYFRNILDIRDTHSIESSENPFDEHPFVKYAAAYWVEHLLPFQAELREQACLFLRDEALTRHAREVNFMVKNKYWGGNKKMNSLHIMAHWGMHVLLQEFMPGEGFTPTISIDSRDSLFRTPLSYAAESGHENIVKILLDYGADATDGNSISPLARAARNGHESIVSLLLDRGVDFNHGRGKIMSIALEMASDGGHERVVRLLLRRGADININHGSALSSAIRGGHEDIVKLLIDTCIDLNTAELNPSMNALHIASRYGRDHIVRFLLKKGADVYINYGSGTALHFAAFGGHETVVKMLIDWGADINAHCESLGTLITYAAEHRQDNITEILLNAGADIDVLGGRFGSLLNTLAFMGNTRVLSTVVERYHADPKLVDFHGRTALLMAAYAKRSDTFHCLLNLGFNPDAKDAKGDGILSYASLGMSQEIFKSALEYSKGLKLSGFWSPLHWACRSGNTYAVERLLEQGYRDELVTLPDSEETWNALSIAIYHDQVGMLKDLSPSSASLLNVESGQRAHRRSGESTYVYCSSCLQVSPQIRFSILTSLDAHQGQSMYFPYYHCRDCLEIDYCFMCKPLLEHLHPHHTWDLLSGPDSPSSGTEF